MDIEKLTDANARRISEEFIQGILPYPGNFHGKGIVICGGGVRYFTNAWVCINMLRRLGCQLPVEFWYLGHREMSNDMISLVQPLNVRCVDGLEVRKTKPARILNGWELKPYAIINCLFKEVLYLDADNVPVVNPEFLFGTREYQETGAIFWPDYNRLAQSRAIWAICGIEYRDEPEIESGQIVLNKEYCWEALSLCMWYNEHSDFYYRHIHGDKETFHMAFRKLNKSYVMPSKGIHSLLGTMCQHDFNGNRIFQHRNTDKWNLFTTNKKVPGFLYEAECFAFLQDLHAKWNGSVFDSEARPLSEDQIAAVTALTSQYFEYRRIGYDQRPLSFMPDGTIGEGARGCERHWRVYRRPDGVFLEICSEKEVTCRLKQETPNVWKGAWLVHEKMPIELEAIKSPE